MKKHSLNQLPRRAGHLGVLGLVSASLAAATLPATALEGGADPVTQTTFREEAGFLDENESGFSDYWSGKYMTGRWFGVRDTLEDNGIKFKGKWNGAFYGVLNSENGAKGFFDQEVAFGAEIDFAKLTKLDALDGLTGFGEVRWRQPASGETPGPNDYVEAQSLFNPSHYQSGTQWRLMTFGLEYTTPEMFGVDNFMTINGGWMRPQKEFIDQPLSKLFVNNTIESSKGIGGNIPFSSSYSTWGGTLQVKPVEDWYVKGGLFMAMPSGTSSSNHGLAFEGFAQDPTRNGLFFLGETGITPTLGPDELPGHYAAGGYYFGVENTSFNGSTYDGQYGFYWQADQMLFREASPAPEPVAPMYAKGPSDGKSFNGDAKSFKSPVSMEETKLSDQGLYTFNIVTFAPKYNNRYPFYFHSGLVYKGLIPTRDKDQTMVAFALGSDSLYRINDQQRDGNVDQANLTAVLEAGYRVQINGWAYTQPFMQYLIKPAGTASTENGFILGVLSGVTF